MSNHAKTALVTGASAGIGATFCAQLAERGYDLVVVARSTDRLEALKTDLEARHGVSVEVVTADLTDPLDVQKVAWRLSEPQRPVDLLVNNAGYGLKKRFLENNVQDEIASLDILVRTVMVLSHSAALAMKERGHGAIVNVSSVASFMASGTYSAAKSYVTVFSESLAGELAGTGVTVTALCPGFTHTEFHERAGINHKGSPEFLWLQADRLVRDCLADVDKGKVISVPGLQYKVITTALRTVPRPLVRRGRLATAHRPQK
ncbi:SDR family oxidoreductase [Allobranchiibius sp. GilTou38]|uniref:SDR family NAD(P)-dependent oxidoreductase n=1 Tax=Allobranchiibius sp. GilTou38 TaxID=2815210 RepID=UPI001AA10A96|nr:SDR family oxidoreductase [Allobranchiibius sp. GilTou38]MBO1767125.1 SDR family oxidoreductase [Allobranchiibius sp. GilTou38]